MTPEQLARKARFGPNHNDALNELAARLQRAEEALRLAYPYVKELAQQTAPDQVRHIIEDDVAKIGKTLAYFSEAPTADPAANAPPASELHPKVLEWTRKHHPERLRPEDREAPTADREEP